MHDKAATAGALAKVAAKQAEKASRGRVLGLGFRV